MLPPAILVVWAACLQGPAAAPPRDAPPVTRASATVTGTVVADDLEARPVRRARVMLTGETTDGRTIVSDERGRFTFADLPPGRFNVSVSKEGWVTTAYGAKRPLRPGTAVLLSPGQRVDLQIRLVRGAVITGVLLDNTGQPAVGTTVRAMRYAMQNGERRLVPGRSSAATDDKGEYRIYGLAPGDYVVGASWRPAFLGTQSSELQLTTEIDVRDARADGRRVPPPPQTIALASTFYPGTAMPAQAAVLSIRSGEERSGVDFTLQLVGTARVDGTIVLPGVGTLPPGIGVSLMATGQPIFPGIPFDGFRRTALAPDGTFSFSDISPGRYTLLARALLPADVVSTVTTAGPQIYWASTELSVDGDNLSGLLLTLTPGLTVKGRVRFEGSLPPPSDLGTIRVMLQAVQNGDAVSSTPSAAKVDAAGQFVLTGIIPGRYRLVASLPGSGKAGGWNVKSALIDGGDALDAPIDIQPFQTQATAEIAFSDHVAQLSGHLQHALGGAAPEYSIVVFPTDQALWTPHSRRIQSVRPAVDGGFAFVNLPPGEYRLVAVDDIEPGQWDDPSILQQLMPSSMTLSIADGQAKVQDVKVGGG